jgi:hypothetical protein
VTVVLWRWWVATTMSGRQARCYRATAFTSDGGHDGVLLC